MSYDTVRVAVAYGKGQATKRDVQMSASAVLRRRLGTELRELRGAAGLSQEQAAERLEMSVRTIQRIEYGDTAVKARDLRHMLDIYAADVKTSDRLLELGRQARQRGWWTSYRRLFPGPYIELEAGASLVRTHSMNIAPGLLQTEAYARAMFATLPTPPGDVDLHVSVRMRRQDRVRSGDLAVAAIVDEALLHRLGDDEIAQAQLTQLIEMADLPNVSLRIVPFAAGRYAGSSVPFAILRFPDPVDTDVVLTETLAWERYFDDAKEVAVYNEIFDAMEDIAMTPDDTKITMERELKRWIP